MGDVSAAAPIALEPGPKSMWQRLNAQREEHEKNGEGFCDQVLVFRDGKRHVHKVYGSFFKGFQFMNRRKGCVVAFGHCKVGCNECFCCLLPACSPFGPVWI